jgi:hypothetical protein
VGSVGSGDASVFFTLYPLLFTLYPFFPKT